MGGRAGFWHYARHVLVITWLLLSFTQAGLVPFTIRPAGTELERRSLSQQADLLKPRHQVELPYASDRTVEQQYVAIVATQHRSQPYVLVEEFEDLLSMIECSSKDVNTSTRLSMKFRHREALAMAKGSWSEYKALTFITHHPSCNDDPEERAVYISSSIQFNEQSLMVVVHCRHTTFGPSRDASTSISFKAGMAPEELRKRLHRRSFGGKTRAQKRAVSTHTFSLDGETWAERESMFGLGPFELNCIECRWSGELSAAFDFHIPNTDWKSLLIDGFDPSTMKGLVDVGEMRLQTTRPIEANLNLELIASAGVKFTFPGLYAGIGEPKFGSKMVKKRKKKFFKVSNLPHELQKEPTAYGDRLLKFGDYLILGTYRYGVSLGVEFYGSVQAVLPVTASIPAGQGVTMNFVNPLASSSSLRPVIKLDQPQLGVIDPESRFSVGIGPGLELTLQAFVPFGRRGAAINMVFQTGIEAPKVETRFVGKSGVNEHCKPGSIPNAIQEKSKVGVGLKLEAWFSAEKDGYLIPRTPLHKWDLGGLLHPSWTVDDRCFDLRRLFLPESAPDPGRAEPQQPPPASEPGGRAPKEPLDPEPRQPPPQPAGSKSPPPAAAGTSGGPGPEANKVYKYRIDPSVPNRIQPFWDSNIRKKPPAKKAD
ncbi:MAG: hypothetical protein M1816_000257 [Peltula sp. TS41687]|nr:MAG: hypothetical protein M1816_000257 [Peltula sp. TS41687]